MSLVLVTYILEVIQSVSILFLCNMAAKKEKDTDQLLKEIGVRLKTLRKRKYSNYEHFAYENDLNRVQYGRYENGNDFRMSTFLKILKALKISPVEFFSEGFD